MGLDEVVVQIKPKAQTNTQHTYTNDIYVYINHMSTTQNTYFNKNIYRKLNYLSHDTLSYTSFVFVYLAALCGTVCMCGSCFSAGLSEKKIRDQKARYYKSLE